MGWAVKSREMEEDEGREGGARAKAAIRSDEEKSKLREAVEAERTLQAVRSEQAAERSRSED